MKARSYRCGCFVVEACEGTSQRETYCSAHAVAGRALVLLAQLAGAKELWDALEANPASAVRELAHSMYYRVERSVGELKAVLDVERELVP